LPGGQEGNGDVKPDEQRTAICNFCKWDYDAAEAKVFFVDAGGDIIGFPWPSLDAMHAAESTFWDRNHEYEKTTYQV
jgi:hypothetical protein